MKNIVRGSYLLLLVIAFNVITNIKDSSKLSVFIIILSFISFTVGHFQKE